jgi:hypothetical protein
MQSVFFNIPILRAKAAIARLLAIEQSMIVAVTAPGLGDAGRFSNSYDP